MNQSGAGFRQFFLKITDRKYARYYLAALVFVIILCTLIFCTDGTARDKDSSAGIYDSFTNETEKETSDAVDSSKKSDSTTEKKSGLHELIEQYYSFYAAGDVDSLEKIAFPISDREKSYIQFFSQYVDKYQNIEVYSKRGLDDKSWLLSVSMEISFKDIKTAAPGLDFFYVSTADDGSLYIDNVYSSFNTNDNEFDMDPDVTALIAAFEGQDDVTALQKKVQEKFNQAMLSDSDLSNFLNVTLSEATTKWSEDYDASVKAAEEQKAADEANKTTVYAAADLTVYAAADQNGASLGTITAGTAITKYADEGDYSRIDYNGQNGYVLTSQITTTDPAAQQEQPAEEPAEQQAEEPAEQPAEQTAGDGTVDVPGLTAGSTITLTTTVRVRSDQDENASIAAVAYVSEPLQIVANYNTGWTAVVTVGGVQGYVKTEVLTQG